MYSNSCPQSRRSCRGVQYSTVTVCVSPMSTSESKRWITFLSARSHIRMARPASLVTLPPLVCLSSASTSAQPQPLPLLLPRLPPFCTTPFPHPWSILPLFIRCIHRPPVPFQQDLNRPDTTRASFLLGTRVRISPSSGYPTIAPACILFCHHHPRRPHRLISLANQSLSHSDIHPSTTSLPLCASFADLTWIGA